MEQLIVLLPTLAPVFNLIIWPIYRHFAAKFEALERENRLLNEKLQALELTLHQDFCKAETCERLRAELLAVVRG